MGIARTAFASPVTFAGLFVIVSALLIGPIAASATNTARSVSVVYCEECVPFQFTNADGQPDGLIIDYWKLWSARTGHRVEYRSAPWNQTLDMVRNGTVDAHAGLFYSEARNAFLDYGATLAQTDTHIFFHQDIAFPDVLSELKSYRIAVVAGDLVEGWLRQRVGTASVVGYADYPSIIAALNSGEVKVFAADTPTGLFHLGRAGLLADFRHQKLKPLYTSDWHPAVRKGNQALLNVVNDGMAKITADERLRIARTWATGQRAEDPDSLIIAIDSYYPPLSSIGIDGAPQGLMVDVWREWGNAVGRKVRFKASAWNQTLNAVRSGEADIHAGLFRTDDRAQWMAFSQPIQTIKTGLYARVDTPDITSFATLNGKRVGAAAGTYQAEYVTDHQTDVELYEAPDRTDYLMALMRGEIAAFVEEVPTVNATLVRFGLSGAVSRRAVLFEKQVFAGVRKDNRALLELVNAGLDKIPRKRLAEIEARWVANPEDRYFADRQGVAHLTSAERAWVAEHPEITVAATSDWPPFEWRDQTSGEHRGISADFICLAAEKVGLKVKPAFDQWTPLVAKLKAKEIDVAPGLNKTPDREAFLLFTEPFVDYFSVIFTPGEREDIREMADLGGKTVAVEKGYALAEIIAKDFPNIRLKEVETTVQALQAVSAGDVDAYVGNQLVGTFLIKKYLITNVRTSGFYNRIPGRFRFGIRDDWPQLRTILDKGLAAITDDERSRIIKTHTGLQLEMGRQLRLSDTEREWINRHREVKLGIDSSWPPFEYLAEDGVYSGLAAGYIEVLSKRLEVSMSPQPALTWSQAIKAIENKTGEVDMLPAVAITPERKAYLNFTKPYLTFPMVIATRKDAPYVGDIDDLNGKKVGVVRNYFTHEVVRTNHKEIVPVLADTVAEGLEDLVSGRSIAFIDNLGVITYEIDRLGIEDIKVAAPTAYKVELSMGVRKDWPELIGILEKGIDTIDDKERAAIRNTWLAVRVNIGWDIKTVLIWALPIGGGALLIILVIVVWNRKMGQEIAQRKKAQADLTVAHEQLGEAMAHIEGSINYASRIQRSVLPDDAILDDLFKDYFILWEPRDVVGGDIYWAGRWGEGTLVCLGDCTGHGVPGAFMTLITTGAMDKALIEVEEGDVGGFLTDLHQTVQRNLGQYSDSGESDDGMELGVCYFAPDLRRMHFASARFDMFVVEDGELAAIKPTRRGIGYRDIPHDQLYETHSIDLRSGMRFYMTSDGLIDQVGGEKRRGFGKKRFRELLLSIHEFPFAQQKAKIVETLKTYQGDEVRRDDVSVLGFSV